MKIKSFRNTSVVMGVLLFSGLAAKVIAYPTNYGPFPPGHEPAAVPLEKCELVREVKPSATYEVQNPNGAIREYRLPAGKSALEQLSLVLNGTTNGWAIYLRNSQSKNLLPMPTTNSMTTDQMKVFSCELNDDGQGPSSETNICPSSK